MKNKKFQSILVGLDLSPYSKKVLQQAIELGRFLKVPVTSIYVAADPMHQNPNGATRTIGLNLDLIKERLEKYYGLKKRHVSSVVAVGLPTRYIVEQAERMKNPLIVIGYKGRSAISRFLLGSVAENVLQRSPFAVWIHHGNKVVRPKKVLVPHDLESRTNTALKTAESLSTSGAKGVEAYYVWEIPAPIMFYDGWIANYNLLQSSADAAIKKFKSSNPKVRLQKSEGYPVEKILDRERKFDLMVLYPHKHSELFHPEGQITNKIVRAAQGPVVVVR